MGKLFSLDSPIMRFLGKVTDCVILNLYWIICCIPIVTIGASTTAFYYTVTKVIRNDRGYITKEFWKSFKSNFKQSTIVWLMILAIYVLAYFDCFYAFVLMKAGTLPKIAFWFMIVIFALVLMWTVYLLPYIARFTNTTKEILKNSVFLMFRNFFWSVQNLIIFVATVVLVLMIPALILALPVICMLLISMSLERVFRKYMTPEDMELEDERNRQYYN